MTTLRFETGGRHQTSPASLRGRLRRQANVHFVQRQSIFNCSFLIVAATANSESPLFCSCCRYLVLELNRDIRHVPCFPRHRSLPVQCRVEPLQDTGLMCGTCQRQCKGKYVHKVTGTQVSVYKRLTRTELGLKVGFLLQPIGGHLVFLDIGVYPSSVSK